MVDKLYKQIKPTFSYISEDQCKDMNGYVSLFCVEQIIHYYCTRQEENNKILFWKQGDKKEAIDLITDIII